MQRSNLLGRYWDPRVHKMVLPGFRPRPLVPVLVYPLPVRLIERTLEDWIRGAELSVG